MRVLSRQFNQFVVGTKYPISSVESLNAYNGAVPSTYMSCLIQLSTVSTFSPVSFDGLSIQHQLNRKRLFDLLGYGINSVNVPDTGNVSNLSTDLEVSLFRLAAYQKIYFDFYRNPYYEGVDTTAFNLDDLFNKTVEGTQADPYINRLRPLSTLRYRNWKMDYFTSVQPSFSGAPFVTRDVDMKSFRLISNRDNGSMTFNPSTTQGSLGDFNSNPASANPSTSKVASLYKSDQQLVKEEHYFDIPVHNIRAAFALDKLYRLQQQSGNGSYGEQIRNRFFLWWCS